MISSGIRNWKINVRRERSLTSLSLIFFIAGAHKKKDKTGYERNREGEQLVNKLAVIGSI